ncbi:MAG TPA: hypothetical protein VGD45_10215 [Steroidobacter sp.]|uniref:hypothetical protein n=1 Tax=Steroidobacter sp. TaxID=1978227 RepID=UPI002ED8ACAD
MADSALGSRRPGRWLSRLLIGVVLLAVVLGGLWTWFSLSWSYSEGERAGILQKFSRKGWICKTYEGELALYVVGGVAPQIWHFSTRDEELAKQLSASVGRHIRLHYTEHRGIPTNCFAETPYFAESFTPVSGGEQR